MIHLSITSALLAAGLLATASGSALAAEVDLQIHSSGPPGGSYYIAVHQYAAGFPGKGASTQLRVPVAANQQSVRLPVLADGRYAIAVFQDLDGDGELGSNLIGMPIEPYGFSRDARGKFGPPDFDDAALSLSGKQRLNIRLNYQPRRQKTTAESRR